MKFKPDQHYLNTAKISGDNASLEIRTDHWHKFDGRGVRAIIIIDTGCAHMQCKITPVEARKFAANLLTLADETEVHEAQLLAELEPA